MSYLIYKNFSATLFLGEFADLPSALPQLQRNFNLVLPLDHRAADLLSINTDAVSVTTATDNTQFQLGLGVSLFTVQGSGSAIIETAARNTVVRGSDAGLTLWGNNLREIGYGGTAADSFFGGAGDDLFYGGSGNDLLVGGGNRDRSYGGAGDDVLVAGPGLQRLYGGSGADMFLVEAKTLNTTTIYDFNAAAGDVLNLQDTLFASFAELINAGRIVQVGTAATITLGTAIIRLENTQISSLTSGNLQIGQPASSLTFASFADFRRSGLDQTVDSVTIGETLYHLRDAQPLHADFKYQDNAGNWWSPDYFIVVAAGQSNMVGAGQGGDLGINPNVVAFDWVNDQLVLADYAASPAGGLDVRSGTALRNNLYFPFANSIAEGLGRPVLVVTHAVSGSRIDSWLADTNGPRWADLLTDINQALALTGQSQVDSFIWLQGESDYSMPVADYQTRMLEFIAQVRGQSWGGPDLAMLIGELSRSGVNFVQNAALQAIEVMNTDPMLGFVSSTGLTSFEESGVHFDGNSLVEYGATRFWNALTALLSQQGQAPNTAPTLSTTVTPPTALTIFEGDELRLDVSDFFADAEGDALWFYGYLSRRGVYLTGTDDDFIVLGPDYAAAGTYTLTIYANDYLLDGASFDITLTVLDRAPGVMAYTGSSFATVLDGYRDFATAQNSLSANRGIDILTQAALNGGPNLITVDSLNIRANGSITADLVLANGVLRTYLTGTAALNVQGNALDNYVIGTNGRNTLAGGAGLDRLYGNGGDDVLRGDGGNDQLYGGAGNDLMAGGGGIDQAWGGLGADRFLFAAGYGRYLARDFNSAAQGDLIELQGFAGISDFDDLLAVARLTQSGDRVIIDIGTDRLMVYGQLTTSLTADMFIFS